MCVYEPVLCSNFILLKMLILGILIEQSGQNLAQSNASVSKVVGWNLKTAYPAVFNKSCISCKHFSGNGPNEPNHFMLRPKTTSD